MFKRLRLVGFFVFVAMLTVSCVGIDADLKIQPDGSGSLSLKYRISRMVESMGKLDDNERWLPLPVGKADFERTVARVKGLSLKSFSSKEDEKDIVVDAELAFTDSTALMSFLDATGRSARLDTANGTKKLSLTLAEGGGPLDPDLEKLVTNVFQGYSVNIRVKTPTPPTSSAPGAVNSGVASVSSPVSDLLSSSEKIIWEISWKE